MEIQIRTKEMDMLTDGRAASHSFYKGGLTDPREVTQLKAIVQPAAELTALRLRVMPSLNPRGKLEVDHKTEFFTFLTKNGDSRISIEELTEVMEELGAGRKDAQELIQLLDANSDGSLSLDEFSLLQKLVNLDIMNANPHHFRIKSHY